MPVLSIARQRGSTSGLGAVAKDTPDNRVRNRARNREKVRNRVRNSQKQSGTGSGTVRSSQEQGQEQGDKEWESSSSAHTLQRERRSIQAHAGPACQEVRRVTPYSCTTPGPRTPGIPLPRLRCREKDGIRPSGHAVNPMQVVGFLSMTMSRPACCLITSAMLRSTQAYPLWVCSLSL
eukprot:355993-Chlamydomonas_euryale.AAC.22